MLAISQMDESMMYCLQTNTRHTSTPSILSNLHLSVLGVRAAKSMKYLFILGTNRLFLLNTKLSANHPSFSADPSSRQCDVLIERRA